MIWIITFFGSLTGFLFGYDEGITSGILSLLQSEFHLTPESEGLLTSSLPFGAFVGTLLTGIFLSLSKSSHIGRRNYLIIAGICFITGDIGALLSNSDLLLTCSRFVIGLATGLSIVVAPMYLSEIAPTRHRGAIIALYQLAITVGIIAAYWFVYIFVDFHSWRIYFVLALIPAITLTAGIFFSPESPRWLIHAGLPSAAESVLIKLRKSSNVQEEIKEMKTAIAQEPLQYDWSAVFRKPMVYILLLGVGLFAIQQLSGIDVIIYYAPEIFKNLGLKQETIRLLATLGIGIVNCLSTLLAIFLIDRLGRRKLLLFGCFGTGLSLFIPAVLPQYFGIMESYISVASLFFFIFSFAIGLGPMPYVIMAEIFPAHVRGAGVGISSLSNWIFNALMVFSFPVLLDYTSVKSLFFMYACFLFTSMVLIARYMPETKKLSLEEIEIYVMSNQPIRNLGRGKGL